jgi:DnaK suppressor protein
MTADQIQQCKDKLLQLQKEHQELELELKKEFETSGDTVTLDQSSVGRLSRMDAMQNQQMALEASRRREMHAEKIEGGLRRIESGHFGHCFYCEEEIPFPRLEADPTNTRCLKCAD